MALVPFGERDIRERGKRADKIRYFIESPVIGRESQIEGVTVHAVLRCAATAEGMWGSVIKKKFLC